MLDLVGDAPALGERREGARDGGAQLVGEDERDEILLRLRVEEDRAFRDAGSLGDRGRRRGIEPALEEERRGRLADARAFVFLVALARHC